MLCVMHGSGIHVRFHLTCNMLDVYEHVRCMSYVWWVLFETVVSVICFVFHTVAADM